MSLLPLRDRRGIALITTLLVTFAVSAIALAAVMMTLNANLIAKNSERSQTVDAAALSGCARRLVRHDARGLMKVKRVEQRWAGVAQARMRMGRVSTG